MSYIQSQTDELARYRLARLAKTLRRRGDWPRGFHWDYRYCDACAIGLAERLFGLDLDWLDTRETLVVIAGYFRMELPDACAIFAAAHRRTWWDLLRFRRIESVAPDEVATLIERYLDRISAGA